MNGDPGATRRRYLAIWFPFLPSDRLRRQADCAAPADRPLVLVEKVGGALKLVAVDPAALQAGLNPGMTLADARARIPDLVTVPHRPDADAALLANVLDDFDRFTPLAALDAPHGIVLDITGCAHLFGGEAGLMQRVAQRAEAIGLQHRSALAGTPQAARAMARFGGGGILADGENREVLRRLPVAALELSPNEALALRRAGLKRLADLEDRASFTLSARFGADFSTRLARIMGREDRRISPHRPPPPCVVDRVFAEPIGRPEDVFDTLHYLLEEATGHLEKLGLGGRAFEAGFYRVDGDVRRVTVRTGRPTRDIDAVARLFRERIAALPTELDAGFGFEQIRLSVPVAEPLAPAQRGLEREQPGSEEISAMIDRLVARLGPEAVLRFSHAGSHLPEREARLVPAERAAGDGAWPAPAPEEPPLRPLQMFDPPQPIEALAEVPDGCPQRFRWRRVVHEVTRAEGPERIAAEWWRTPGQPARDYYRVEDREGRRFWLFRAGNYGDEPGPRWFVHGLFA